VTSMSPRSTVHRGTAVHAHVEAAALAKESTRQGTRGRLACRAVGWLAASGRLRRLLARFPGYLVGWAARDGLMDRRLWG
jgi:hypothetical protein